MPEPASSSVATRESRVTVAWRSTEPGVISRVIMQSGSQQLSEFRSLASSDSVWDAKASAEPAIVSTSSPYQAMGGGGGDETGGDGIGASGAGDGL